jgi:hypothetical protein
VKQTEGKIFYFNDKLIIDSAQGCVTGMAEVSGEGLFIDLNTGVRIRIDRIITLFGRPGAAYDEYDGYGNVCLSCTGGYDL